MLHEHTLCQVRNALAHPLARVRRVTTRVRDLNGPRGGLDTRCDIHVVIEGAGDQPVQLDTLCVWRFPALYRVKMLVFANQQPDLEANPLLCWMRSHIRITNAYHGERFFIVRQGVRYATPLFLVLVLIEVTDLVFAVDCIPPIFAITSDPFIVFTSSMFAIMGLRALYFLLSGMADRFHYLKYGLAVVLVFIGGKMLAAHWVHLPVQISLGVVGVILAVSMLVSLALPARQAQ